MLYNITNRLNYYIRYEYFTACIRMFHPVESGWHTWQYMAILDCPRLAFAFDRLQSGPAIGDVPVEAGHEMPQHTEVQQHDESGQPQCNFGVLMGAVPNKIGNSNSNWTPSRSEIWQLFHAVPPRFVSRWSGLYTEKSKVAGAKPYSCWSEDLLSWKGCGKKHREDFPICPNWFGKASDAGRSLWAKQPAWNMSEDTTTHDKHGRCQASLLRPHKCRKWMSFSNRQVA